MGIFGKLKKTEESADRKSTFVGHLDVDLCDWKQVFSACLGKEIAIQNACSELVVKNRNWHVDFSRGIISFGLDEYPIQFIGSEAKSSATWLWGWENINGFPDELIGITNYTREIGQKWGLEPLTVAEQALDDTFNGHNFSIVTCGLTDNQYCYYRGPHDHGAIFVAFSGVPEEVFAPVDMMQFISITTQCIQQFSVDHKIFAESFLLWNGTKYEWNDNQLVAHFSNDVVITFEQVENAVRISGIQSKL